MSDQPARAFHHQPYHDKLASDRIGEELNPEACIWRLYEGEAKPYDTEVTHGRGKNLDNMLLFATLFSAIVTAFLSESMSLLQQDSSGVSIQLLLMLVQSQQRIETRTPNSTSPPVEIPTFAPSAAARAINVLWFSSLSCSLGAAVFALIAKEWLLAFTTYRTRHAHEYALERRSRLTSIDTWNMFPIIDFLPTLLNVGVLIFSIGLIVRLWLIDYVVAGVVTVLTAIVCGSYFFFLISSAIYRDCPYKTRLTRYLRMIISWKKPQNSRSTEIATPQTKSHIKLEQMEVLDWLFEHSRDPTLKSYVTQALAGLKSLSIGLPTFLNNEVENLDLLVRDSYKHNSKLLSRLFDLGAQTADQLQMALTRSPSGHVPRESSSTARLILAMSEIYPYALTWQIYGNTLEISQHKPLNIDMLRARKITGNIITAFGALDRLVWAESSPALRLSAYIRLVSAELKMSRYALASLSVPKVKNTAPSSRHRSIEMRIIINLPNLDRERLRERHSLALSRVALVIKSSLEHLTSKWGQKVQVAIGDLLFEATELVKQDKPIGRDNAFSYPSNEDISITIATENNTTRHVTCRRKAHNVELIEILIGLCGGDASMDILHPQGFQVAAFNLLVALWPAYQRERRLDEGVAGKIPLQGVKDGDKIPFQNIDVFAHLRSTHSAIQLANATPEHPGLQVDQVMRSIYPAFQATSRDVTTPVRGDLLGQITSYILEASSGCQFCLRSFTEGPGFSILEKLGQIESDRAAAVGAVRALLAKLHTAQLYVNAKAVRPLFEAIRLVCDSDGHQDDQGIDSFIDDALFQLQRLPESTSPFVSREEFPLIQAVFGKLEGREGERSGSGSSIQVKIASLKRRVEQRAKELFEGATTNASGGLDYRPAVPPTTILDPQLNTTGSVPGDKANNLPQNYWNPAPLDTGNTAQGGSSSMNTAPSLKTDDKPSRAAGDTSGSGHHHSFPAEAEKWSETTDEGVTPTGKQGEEGR